MAIMTLLAPVAPAHAHKASDAYLDLRTVAAAPGTFAARWDIAIRDLDMLVDLDPDDDGVVRWRDVDRRGDEVARSAMAALAFARDGVPCEATAPERTFGRRSDGGYLVLRFSIACPAAPTADRRGRPEDAADGSGIEVRYQLMAGIDPTHRAILSVPGAGVGLTMLRQSTAFQRVATSTVPDTFGSDVAGFLVDGFRHILNGPDHLAFLLALLVVALAGPGRAATRSAATGQLAALRAALPALVVTVSVFTLAHSITLALTAFGRIPAPSRWVEAAVALSVAVGGLQAALAATLGRNHRLAGLPIWLVFAFGLVHGIGFGSSLNEAGFGGRSALSALLGFNLGVEVGQLSALVVTLPLAAILVAMPRFRRWGLAGVGASIAGAGVSWLFVRVTA